MSRQLFTQAIVGVLACAFGKPFEERCDTQVPALLLYCTPNPAQVPRWEGGVAIAASNFLGVLKMSAFVCAAQSPDWRESHFAGPAWI